MNRKTIVLGGLIIPVFLLLISSVYCEIEKPIDRNLQIDALAAIENRVHEMMSYRQKGQMQGVYDMLVPKQKEDLSFEQFKSSAHLSTINLRSYVIEDIKLETETSATVWVSEYVNTGLMGACRVLRDNQLSWEKVDDKWYLVYKSQEKKPVTSGPCGGLNRGCGASGQSQTSETSSSTNQICGASR